MEKTSEAMDGSAKLWLAVLLVGFIAFVTVLAHGFKNTPAPQDPEEFSSAPQAPAPEGPSELRAAKSETTWSYPETDNAADSHPVTVGVEGATSYSKSPTQRRKDAAAAKALVHKQAEQFRTMVKQEKLPEALGNLSLEQIDELEKNNVAVW